MNSDMALFHVFLIAAPMARARLKIGKSDFSRYYLLQARYFYPRNLHNMGINLQLLSYLVSTPI